MRNKEATLITVRIWKEGTFWEIIWEFYSSRLVLMPSFWGIWILYTSTSHYNFKGLGLEKIWIHSPKIYLPLKWENRFFCEQWSSKKRFLDDDSFLYWLLANMLNNLGWSYCLHIKMRWLLKKMRFRYFLHVLLRSARVTSSYRQINLLTHGSLSANP